jgi:TRAP-type C4-dicarboxylate transport system substrate-binding protein
MVSLAVCACACITMPINAFSDEIINLKAATIYPLKHRIVTDCFNLYDQQIRKLTNGKVKITWFHASSLANFETMYDSVKSGMIDLGWIGVESCPHLWPITKGISLPFMTDSALHAARIADAMWNSIPDMQKEFAPFHYLGVTSTDIVNIHWTEKKALKSLDQLRGMRIAAFGSNQMPMLEAWPCAAQFITISDSYLALQRKMVDGILVPNAPMRAFKLTDVTQGHTMGDFMVSPFAWVMNKGTWDKLPADVQKAFNNLNPSMPLLAGHTLTNEGLWVVEALKKRGDVFYYLTPEEKAKWKSPLMPLYDAYAQELSSKGLDGKAILAKIQEISEQTRKNPSTRIDEWWKSGRMGKKD